MVIMDAYAKGPQKHAHCLCIVLAEDLALSCGAESVLIA